MDKSYKRVENIDEKIQDVKLTYNAWRTLFLIADATPAAQIAEILEEETEVIDKEIQSLLDNGLIEEVGLEEPQAAPEPEIPQVVEEEEVKEVVEEAAEEVPTETEKAAGEEEPVIEEIPEEIAEEPQAEEEVTPEPEPAEEQREPEVAEPEAEEPQVEVPAEEEPAVVEPEPEAEEPETVAEDEDIEINIHDEAQADEDLLDIDFGTEEETKEEEPVDEEPLAEVVQEAPAAVEEPPVPVAEAPAPASGKKSVLVVDDSIVIRKMVEIALENEDLSVHTAVSGKDGLDKIDRLNPSLIILDLMLPDINGIDILKTVKASRNIPVIMLSGKDSPQMVEKAKETGANAFLPKPFKDDELIEQIKNLLNM